MLLHSSISVAIGARTKRGGEPPGGEDGRQRSRSIVESDAGAYIEPASRRYFVTK